MLGSGSGLRHLVETKKGGVPAIRGGPRFLCSALKRNLSRQRPLKNRRAWTPQRIALRIAMGMRMRKPIRMADGDVAVAIAIPRRGLRQPRRITDRAECDRCCMNVVADGLQPLQYRLPLFPIQLPQDRSQSLDERIFQQ